MLGISYIFHCNFSAVNGYGHVIDKLISDFLGLEVVENTVWGDSFLRYAACTMGDWDAEPYLKAKVKNPFISQLCSLLI